MVVWILVSSLLINVAFYYCCIREEDEPAEIPETDDAPDKPTVADDAPAPPPIMDVETPDFVFVEDDDEDDEYLERQPLKGI